MIKRLTVAPGQEIRGNSWSGLTCKLGCRLLLAMAPGQEMRGQGLSCGLAVRLLLTMRRWRGNSWSGLPRG